MSKVIEVEKCEDCPFAKSEATYLICTHQQAKLNRGNAYARVVSKNDPIPDWCPLEDSEDFAESNFDIDRKF